ncbi:MAG: fumarylacetoacetase [Gemmatimonadota bacterium]|nr:fumarylacetoacetase [Gemmatimonadota bacterium]
MIAPTDETHRPDLRSWVESANDPATDFPIQNLPFGIFMRRGSAEQARVGVAIGDQILDVSSVARGGAFGVGDEAALAAAACCEASLNALMAQGRGGASALRRAISALLRADANAARRSVAAHLVPRSDAELFVPAAVGDYTDFYASVFHATNVGGMFRPDNPLLPNYKYLPIGYHGRASSVVVSGTPVRRPRGQTRDDASGAPPVFGPTRRLDYELEVGAFVGAGNALGEPIGIERAEEHVFGLCLVNDWSARDIQAWEYQPLGPFLAKSFATTVSPWVVTIDALAPFRAPAFERPRGDPPPLPYLDTPDNRARGALDVTLEVHLSSRAMRDRGDAPLRVSRSSLARMYWTIAQMVAHHTSNGCNLRPGDLLASGTVSGDTKDSRGCLLELTWRGTEPLQLPTGETRRFLEDGDEVVLRGYCEREGWRRIGFGECRGVVLESS